LVEGRAWIEMVQVCADVNVESRVRIAARAKKFIMTGAHV
jgi:hypothetical protein